MFPNNLMVALSLALSYFRRDWLTLVSSYVYKDSDDVFEREPFVARFQSRQAGKYFYFTL